MEKEKKVILIILVLIVILLIFLGIVIMKLNKEKEAIYGNEYVETMDEKQDISYNVSDNIEKIQNHQMYYTINNILSSYIESIQNLNGDINNVKINQEKEYLKIENVLDDEYKNEMSMSKDKYLNQIKKFKLSNEKKLQGTSYYFIIDDIYQCEMSVDIELYFVEYSINNIKDKIIVKLDHENRTYSLFLKDYIEKNNYIFSNIGKEDIRINTKSIELNNYNKFNFIPMNEKDIVIEYFNLYKSMMLNNVEKAYELLQKEYREKRFGSIQAFKKYIEDNKKDITSREIKSYLINRYEEYTEYVLKDQYDNLYIIKETDIMKYTVTLDTYTLEQEKFNTTYIKATNREKVSMNIGKFFDMINSKDYKTAYELLSEGFKENKFKTENSFQEYIKETLYSYNNIKLVKFSDEISGVYTYYIEVYNKEDEKSPKIKMNIIMQLLEETEFVMSFEKIEE